MIHSAQLVQLDSEYPMLDCWIISSYLLDKLATSITAIFEKDGTACRILMKEEIYDLVKIFQIPGVSCVPGDIVSPTVCLYT